MTKPRPRWIILYAVALHLVWAVLLCASPTPLGATPLAVFRGLPRLVAAGLLLVAGVTAVWAVRRVRVPSQWTLLAVLPQQAVLTVSAWSAAAAMWAAHYADGVPRPRGFIVADQAPVVLTAILHTLAVVEMHKRHTRVGDCPGCWWPARSNGG